MTTQETTGIEVVSDPVAQRDEQPTEGAAAASFIPPSDDIQQPEYGRGARVHIPTERGLAFEIETKQRNLRASIRQWQKQAESVEILLSDVEDPTAIRSARAAIIQYRDEVEEIADALVHLSPTDPHTKGVEDVSNGSRDLIKRIGVRLREIESEAGSYKSHRTASSRASSRGAKLLMKTKAAARAAELQEELRYFSKEQEIQRANQQMKLELQRVKKEKELAMAEARLHAISREEMVEETSEEPSTEEETAMTALRQIPMDEGKMDRFFMSADDSQRNETTPKVSMPSTGLPSIDRLRSLASMQFSVAQAKESQAVTRSTTVSSPATLPVFTSVTYSSSATVSRQRGMSAQANASQRDVRPKVSVPTCSMAPLADDDVQTFLRDAYTAMDYTTVAPSTTVPATTYQTSFGRQHMSNADDVVKFGYQPPVVSSIWSTPHGISSGSNLNPHAPSFVPPATQSDSTTLVQLLARQINLSRLPPSEPGIFSGDPLEYQSWKSSFELLIDDQQIRASEKLQYLKKYLSGDARECIQGFLMESSETAFQSAKEMLDQRFGDPFHVANAFRKKLVEWPKVSQRDGKALQKLSDFLCQIESAMRHNGHLNILNDCLENQVILKKLPEHMVIRWARNVHEYKSLAGVYPPFAVFSQFVRKEAKLACDPVTSLHALKDTQSKDLGAPKKKDRKERSQIFATQADGDKKEKKATTETRPKKPCHMCSEAHHLDLCPSFLKKTVEERLKYVADEKLCYACLGVKHQAKRCRFKKRCKTCQRRHPTSLHKDAAPEKKDSLQASGGEEKKPKQAQKTEAKPMVSTQSHVTHYARGIVEGTKTSMIVPVYVSVSGKPHREELTYAMLDPQSDTTFILDETCRRIGVSGAETSLKLSTMSSVEEIIHTTKITNLIVRGISSSEKIYLPPAYTRPSIPVHRSQIPTPGTARQWPHLRRVANEIAPLQDVEIGLLIGSDSTIALAPRDVIPPENDGPYAQKSALGWGIIGNTTTTDSRTCHRIATARVTDSSSPGCFIANRRISAKEVVNPEDVARLLSYDFAFPTDKEYTKRSIEDDKFIRQLEEGIEIDKDGHYEMPLPFRSENPTIPNNKSVAERRLRSLKRRLSRDKKYHDDYLQFMNDIISRGFAEKVPEDAAEPKGRVCYIPHHGIYHPRKPGKIRVVFSCNSLFQGVCLNDLLLQGPDMLNALLGVLCRFRKEQIAISCDIERMFYQFRVREDHRDFLRFLWFDGGDLSREPSTYRMTVHIFGAVSSPGCANFGLKRAADDGESQFGKKAANFIRTDFYVDDGLTSTATVTEAIELTAKTRELCAQYGLRLHKFASNSREVLESIPTEDRAKGLENLDILRTDNAIERALGIEWNIEADQFQFRINIKERPLTKRGILSAVSSIYDPLGFLAPVVLTGRSILQYICKLKSDWDDPLPEEVVNRWLKWKNELFLLETCKIERCYKPKDFGDVETMELHHFSDASTVGYGQCSYLRLIDVDGRVHCSLVMGKARVAPVKVITVPRLELCAAVLSVRVSKFLTAELKCAVKEVFWTDSDCVIGYVSNDARRFHTFVANRVQQIRNETTPEQWRHVSTKVNPADYASRGLSAPAFLENTSWLNGPMFLWNRTLPDDENSSPDISQDDPEVRKAQVCATTTSEKGFDLSRLEHMTRWYRVKRAIANCLLVKHKLLSAVRIKRYSTSNIQRKTKVDVDMLQEAERDIIKTVQLGAFPEEIETLKQAASRNGDRTKCLKRSSPLYKLDPFMCQDGLIRIGGRLGDANLAEEVKHPVVLPKTGHIAVLIARYYHERVQHQGRGITINAIRQAGYWILGCRQVVSSMINKCVRCRKLRGSLQTQKMADLPPDRTEMAEPFTYAAVDLFGPFLIKEGRKELKRYGVLFTCLTSRAVHIETANSLSTDSFINALRRMISIRGPVRQL